VAILLYEWDCFFIALSQWLSRAIAAMVEVITFATLLMELDRN
jgi:hypothetical protein